ncbi:MAG TPA: glycosyltransferase family 39 protein [Candidatus Acidoferrum sp.]|nr:glycosyltransferase family 39 protein [Candidatus Acidoferrum sp.]
MKKPTKSPFSDYRTTRVALIVWSLLICATLYVCYFSHLGVLGFVGPDEPRYAWIARAMMESHDWTTPRLYGKPWFEKPPLYYWGAGIAFKWFGVSEAAARLPSAVSALLATIALAWLARRLYGHETARWSLLLLPTTAGMIGFSHAAATDMPFSSTFTMAMICAAVVLGLAHDENTPILPRTPWIALILFGFFLGAAVLAKGPAAIILCGGAVFLWALLTKRRQDALQLLHPVAIAFFCATTLPWYVRCARRNPDFLRAFIIEHNFKRYLTPEFQHIRPFWFYLPVVLIALLPWTALFLWSGVHGIARVVRTQTAQHSKWFLACWAGFCLLFFSISLSKLPGYILPALPALVLIFAHSLTTMDKIPRWLLRAGLLLFSLLLFGPLVYIELLAPQFPYRNATIVTGVCSIVALMGAANLLLASFGRPARQRGLLPLLAAGCVVPILLATVVAYFIAPSFLKLDPSGKILAQQVQKQGIPLDELAVGWMSRGQHFGMNFYLHQEIRDWNLENSGKQYVLTDIRGCRNLDPIPFACEPMPFDEQATGMFLYHIVMRGSVQPLGLGPGNGGGQTQKKE